MDREDPVRAGIFHTEQVECVARQHHDARTVPFVERADELVGGQGGGGGLGLTEAQRTDDKRASPRGNGQLDEIDSARLHRASIRYPRARSIASDKSRAARRGLAASVSQRTTTNRDAPASTMAATVSGGRRPSRTTALSRAPPRTSGTPSRCPDGRAWSAWRRRGRPRHSRRARRRRRRALRVDG